MPQEGGEAGAAADGAKDTHNAVVDDDNDAIDAVVGWQGRRRQHKGR